MRIWEGEAACGQKYATQDGTKQREQGENLGVEMMNEVTHPSIWFLLGCSDPAAGLFADLVLIATVTWGQDESNPHSERSFLFEGEESPSPAFFRARTQGAMFLKITKVGYNTII